MFYEEATVLAQEIGGNAAVRESKCMKVLVNDEQLVWLCIQWLTCSY